MRHSTRLSRTRTVAHYRSFANRSVGDADSTSLLFALPQSYVNATAAAGKESKVRFPYIWQRVLFGENKQTSAILCCIAT